MIDIVSSEKRSQMMSGIRGKNTQPELRVRHYLHAQGFRFRIHDRMLPGKPDLVLRKWKTVVFVHGCFWHAHDCRYFKLPKTRAEFWSEKLAGNKVRDEANSRRLEALGWRVLVVYECALRDSPDEALALLAASLRSDTVVTHP
jgi:DNA mismatch endonuclease (patch repair protein)